MLNDQKNNPEIKIEKRLEGMKVKKEKKGERRSKTRRKRVLD